jgi:hypothetical protein
MSHQDDTDQSIVGDPQAGDHRSIWLSGGTKITERAK